ncbi:MAG: hypothetical protein KDD55_07015, partial [Bdellovibrionales bacterium]|nr:hypothetical protein [Bdellovibrionales bacterium]
EPKLRPLHPASGPMGYLCAPFHIPVTSLGVGHSDSRVHAPNENILLENFYKSTAHMAVLLEELAGSQDKTD